MGVFFEKIHRTGCASNDPPVRESKRQNKKKPFCRSIVGWNCFDHYNNVGHSCTWSRVNSKSKLSDLYVGSLFFYVTVLGLAQTLKLQDYRPLIFPFGILLIAFTLIMAPNTVHYSKFISDIWPFYAMTFGFLLPLILLIITKVQKNDRCN